MIIKSVHYRELVSGPGFNNRSIGVEAEVEADETPEEALEKARVWTREQFALNQEVVELRAERDRLTVTVNYLKSERTRLEGLVTAAQKIAAMLDHEEQSPF